jgi:cytochrome c oxidase subunit 2
MSFLTRLTRSFGIGGIGTLAVLVLATTGVLADTPRPWEMGMQAAATPVAERQQALHNELLVIITLISVFVLALLLYAIVRFNEKRNPTPSRTSHNTVIEVLWTVVPVLILVIIAIPSFKLLYFQDRTTNADMTVKVTGRQWYWSYEYPDNDNITFDSNMIQDTDLKPGQIRLLDVDNRLVVPVDTNVRVLVAGSDVMHSFFVPSLGVQTYSVVGRLNETWFNIRQPGVYRGECNQICGVNHAFMPIVVEAVSKDDFQRWVEDAKKKFAHNGAPASAAVQVAQSAGGIAAAQ